MRGTLEFYQTQIDQFAGQAAACILPRQREMYLRSQAAWQALADQETRAVAERAKRMPPPRSLAGAEPTS